MRIIQYAQLSQLIEYYHDENGFQQEKISNIQPFFPFYLLPNQFVVRVIISCFGLLEILLDFHLGILYSLPPCCSHFRCRKTLIVFDFPTVTSFSQDPAPHERMHLMNRHCIISSARQKLLFLNHFFLNFIFAFPSHLSRLIMEK